MAKKNSLKLGAAWLAASVLLSTAVWAKSAPTQTEPKLPLSELPLPELPELPELSGASNANLALSNKDPNAMRVLLSPAAETTLVSQLAGNVLELPVGLGEAVKKGQTLLRFSCDEARARLNMSQAEHSAAAKNVQVKRRLQQLDAAGAIEVELAQAESARTHAAIAVNKAQLAHCQLTAPFAGRVVKLHVQAYQGVNQGAPLIELVSDGPLKIRLNVPSNLLPTLQSGAGLTVHIHETGNSYPAEITAINARVDAVSQTIALEARLMSEHPELLPGMSGTAQLSLATTNTAPVSP